jgi:hypothetical protein
LVVFDEFFKRQDTDIKALYEQAKVMIPKLPDGLTEKIRGIINDLVVVNKFVNTL